MRFLIPYKFNDVSAQDKGANVKRIVNKGGSQNRSDGYDVNLIFLPQHGNGYLL